MKSARLILLLFVSGLVACGGGGGGGGSNATGGGNPAGQANPFRGVWTSSANGESYSIEGDVVRRYQHDSQFCLVAETFGDVGATELQATFTLSHNNQQLAIKDSDGPPQLHAPIVHYNKADALPPQCDYPIAKRGEAGYQRNPVRDLELFGQTFSEHYVSFERKGIDWEASLAAALASVSTNTSDTELMEVIYELTLPLADAHVHVSSEELGGFSADGKPTLVARLIAQYMQSNNLSEPLLPSSIDALNHYISEQLSLREAILFSYAEDDVVKAAANDNLRWFTVDNIAYLYIGAMTGFAGTQDDASAELTALEQALDRIMSDIQDAEGLIIDIRSNNGGRDFLSMAIASRFISSETLGFSKQSREGSHSSELEEVYIAPRGSHQYLGPIALLTSNSTVSAAEVFALMMRSLPNVTLVGESTQGALSDALQKVMPNGFTFSLSNQYYFDASGEWFEHTGIPVDIEVPYFTQQERDETVDLGLETAYAFLVGQD
ncbi:MAG: S41 family peptidase [Halioglobus sp.]